VLFGEYARSHEEKETLALVSANPCFAFHFLRIGNVVNRLEKDNLTEWKADEVLKRSFLVAARRRGNMEPIWTISLAARRYLEIKFN
jgi:hypothetical protein